MHLVGCLYYLYFVIFFFLDLLNYLNLTLILKTWRILWAPNNACKWQTDLIRRLKFNIYLWILRDMGVYISPLHKCLYGLVPKYLQQEKLWNAQRCSPTQFLTYWAGIQVWTWQSIYFSSFWYMADRIPFQSNIKSMRNCDQKRGLALQYELYVSVREFMYFQKFHSR